MFSKTEFEPIIPIFILRFLVDAVYVLPERVLTRQGKSYTILIKDDVLTPVQCFLDDGENKYELNLETTGIPPKLIISRGLVTQKVSDSKYVYYFTTIGNYIFIN